MLGEHAMEMLLTGEMVPAARAAEIGLVNAVVDDADLTDHVIAVAHKIASKSPVTLAIESAFYTQRELSIGDAKNMRRGLCNMLHRDAVGALMLYRKARTEMVDDKADRRQNYLAAKLSDGKLSDGKGAAK